jgi:hypothetical protein
VNQIVRVLVVLRCVGTESFLAQSGLPLGCLASESEECRIHAWPDGLGLATSPGNGVALDRILSGVLNSEKNEFIHKLPKIANIKIYRDIAGYIGISRTKQRNFSLLKRIY